MYEKIVKLCKEKGINIYNLESALGYANGTIRKWKKNTPRVDKLKAVADFFGVTVDYLITDERHE